MTASKKSNPKVEAVLIGGPSDGLTLDLAEVVPKLSIAHRVLERSGKWRVIAVVDYTLKSKGPPVEYKFAGASKALPT